MWNACKKTHASAFSAVFGGEKMYITHYSGLLCYGYIFYFVMLGL